jgi:chromosome segregation ATPase
MNDQRLLEDIKELHSMINIAFKPLLNDANQIKAEAERIVQEIDLKYQSHKNTIKSIKEFSDRLDEIGGTDKFSELLERLTINNQLLNQYPNLTEQVDKSLEKYSELKKPLEIQLERTTTAKETLIEAHNQIEELRAFCAELLDVRELLRNIGGSRGLYASMEEVTSLISHFKLEWDVLEVRLSDTFHQGINLLSQLKEKQESALQFLAIHENLAEKITLLEESVNNYKATLATTQTSLTNVEDCVRELDIKIISRIESIHQHFTSDYEKLKQEINVLDSSANSQAKVLANTNQNIIELKKNLNGVENHSEELRKEIQSIHQHFTSDYEKLKQEINVLDSSANSQAKVLANTNQNIIELKKNLNGVENHSEELDKQVQFHSSEIQTISNKFITLDQAVNSHGSRLSVSNKSIESLESKVDLYGHRIQKWVNFKVLIGLFVLGLTGGVLGSFATIYVGQCLLFSGNQSQICRPSK